MGITIRPKYAIINKATELNRENKLGLSWSILSMILSSVNDSQTKSIEKLSDIVKAAITSPENIFLFSVVVISFSRKN